jgi:hypothetical protein
MIHLSDGAKEGARDLVMYDETRLAGFGQLGLSPYHRVNQLPCDSSLVPHDGFIQDTANMRPTTLLLPLYTAALATALSHPRDQVVLQEPHLTIVEPDEYLIELSPGETRWVTENEKWELRKVCLQK